MNGRPNMLIYVVISSKPKQRNERRKYSNRTNIRIVHRMDGNDVNFRQYLCHLVLLSTERTGKKIVRNICHTSLVHSSNTTSAAYNTHKYITMDTE